MRSGSQSVSLPVAHSVIFSLFVEEFPISTVDMQAPSLPRITPLGARTLSCHVAYLKPLAEHETQSARRATINRLLKSVVGFRHGLHRNHRFQVLETEWESIPVTFRVRLHEELISSLIYIHVDRAHNSANEIVSKLNEYFDAFADVATRGLCTGADWPSKCHKFLFEEVWASFFSGNKERIPPPSPEWPHYPPELANPNIIANFRGLIIEQKRDLAAGIDNERIAQSLGPFLCCTGKQRIEDLSVSTLKRGRAFHASTLGQSSSGAYDAETHRYVVCSHSLDQEELGDLINTGHELGILRLLAIRPLPDLEKAEELLFQIEREIDRTLETPPSERGSAEIRESIGQKFRALNNMFGGDIRSRIIRSTRYKNNITALINTIDVLDVRTFKSLKQKYEAIIDNTIGRAERLRLDYDRVYGEFRSARHLAALEGTAKSAAETATRNTRIQKLQETAEFFLFFALVPYYIGNNLSETAHAVIPLFVNKDKNEFLFNVVYTVIWLFAGALSVSLGARWFATYHPKTPIGKIAKMASGGAIKLWFKFFRRPSMRSVVWLILFSIEALLLFAVFCS